MKRSLEGENPPAKRARVIERTAVEPTVPQIITDPITIPDRPDEEPTVFGPKTLQEEELDKRMRVAKAIINRATRLIASESNILKRWAKVGISCTWAERILETVGKSASYLQRELENKDTDVVVLHFMTKNLEREIPPYHEAKSNIIATVMKM